MFLQRDPCTLLTMQMTQYPCVVEKQHYAQERNTVPRSRTTIQLRYASYACCMPHTFDAPLYVTIMHVISSSSSQAFEWSSSLSARVFEYSRSRV